MTEEEKNDSEEKEVDQGCPILDLDIRHSQVSSQLYSEATLSVWLGLESGEKVVFARELSNAVINNGGKSSRSG